MGLKSLETFFVKFFPELTDTVSAFVSDIDKLEAIQKYKKNFVPDLIISCKSLGEEAIYSLEDLIS
ncbi:hypothetical protein OCUAc17_29700 [Acinetobacter pittii]|nr:hypothetical protein OCUAc17_29700 [Acinetobacter pittii]